MSSLKEQNGKYYQQCQVVMLSTDKPNINSLALNSVNKLSLILDERTVKFIIRPTADGTIRPQHLYFLSHHEIQEGDWFLCTYTNNISNTLTGFEKKECCKKIIATTDESLYYIDSSWKNKELGRPNGIYKYLPKPSDSFIKKYIEEYNAGRQITDVLVEYCKIEYLKEFNSIGLTTDIQLKIDSGNTITTTKLKDSYSREEVIKLLYKALGHGNESSEAIDIEDVTDWIKENL